MKTNVLRLAIVLSLLGCTLAYYTCPSGAKSPAKGKCYGENCHCATGVQAVCLLDKVKIGHTTTWKRGSNIADICKSGKWSQYKNAAIATFYGSKNTYNTADSKNQHAAIFLSCKGTDGSINVNDQYKSKATWSSRPISFKDAKIKDVNNARYYYLIE